MDLGNGMGNKMGKKDEMVLPESFPRSFMDNLDVREIMDFPDMERKRKYGKDKCKFLLADQRITNFQTTYFQQFQLYRMPLTVLLTFNFQIPPFNQSPTAF